MESDAYAVLSEIHANGGRCDYAQLLERADDAKEAHLTAALLQRDGYIYQPTKDTVAVV